MTTVSTVFMAAQQVTKTSILSQSLSLGLTAVIIAFALITIISHASTIRSFANNAIQRVRRPFVTTFKTYLALSNGPHPSMASLTLNTDSPKYAGETVIGIVPLTIKHPRNMPDDVLDEAVYAICDGMAKMVEPLQAITAVITKDQIWNVADPNDKHTKKSGNDTDDDSDAESGAKGTSVTTNMGLTMRESWSFVAVNGSTASACAGQQEFPGVWSMSSSKQEGDPRLVVVNVGGDEQTLEEQFTD